MAYYPTSPVRGAPMYGSIGPAYTSPVSYGPALSYGAPLQQSFVNTSFGSYAPSYAPTYTSAAAPIQPQVWYWRMAGETEWRVGYGSPPIPTTADAPSRKAGTATANPKVNKAGKFILHYFPVKGLAEISRYMFALAGVEYTDHRIPRDEWNAMKASKTEFYWSKMPCLEVDGKFLQQSKAIERFIARRFGFIGKNDVEAAKIEGVVEQLGDAIFLFMKTFFGPETDQEKKNAALLDVLETKIPEKLQPVEKIVGNEWSVGTEVSYADISIFAMFESLSAFKGFEAPATAMMDKFPKLKQIHGRVKALPAIDNWIKTRPADS